MDEPDPITEEERESFCGACLAMWFPMTVEAHPILAGLMDHVLQANDPFEIESTVRLAVSEFANMKVLTPRAVSIMQTAIATVDAIRRLRSLQASIDSAANDPEVQEYLRLRASALGRELDVLLTELKDSIPGE
jgi:hypothetical protein